MPERGAPPSLHDTGRGPALLFLHPFPLDASQWDHQVAALSGRFRCLRPDMRGCGGSPPPLDPLQVSLDAYAAAVLAGLDDAGVGVIGSSMGGYTALATPTEVEATARSLPSGEFVPIPDVGHLPNLEDPPAFTEVLSEFLRRFPV